VNRYPKSVSSFLFSGFRIIGRAPVSKLQRQKCTTFGGGLLKLRTPLPPVQVFASVLDAKGAALRTNGVHAQVKAHLRPETLIVSIAAGITLKSLQVSGCWELRSSSYSQLSNLISESKPLLAISLANIAEM
jgi:hypothetical protein